MVEHSGKRGGGEAGQIEIKIRPEKKKLPAIEKEKERTRFLSGLTI